MCRSTGPCAQECVAGSLTFSVTGARSTARADGSMSAHVRVDREVREQCYHF